MASQILRPRKRRTRQHVIADLSVHYVEGFILQEGHTVQRLDSDYRYDLIMWTFDVHGYAEPGAVYFQLKAREKLDPSGTDFSFDLDMRDYNLWVREELPVVLVLFDATQRRGYWLAIQPYFNTDTARQPTKGAKSVRVWIPRRQVVSRRAIAQMRDQKSATIRQKQGEIS